MPILTATTRHAELDAPKGTHGLGRKGRITEVRLFGLLILRHLYYV
jgi:hypothetical protein